MKLSNERLSNLALEKGQIPKRVKDKGSREGRRKDGCGQSGPWKRSHFKTHALHIPKFVLFPTFFFLNGNLVLVQ